MEEAREGGREEWVDRWTEGRRKGWRDKVCGSMEIWMAASLCYDMMKNIPPNILWIIPEN